MKRWNYGAVASVLAIALAHPVIGQDKAEPSPPVLKKAPAPVDLPSKMAQPAADTDKPLDVNPNQVSEITKPVPPEFQNKAPAKSPPTYTVAPPAPPSKMTQPTTTYAPAYAPAAYKPPKEFDVFASADGKTLHMVGEINVGSAIILKNAIRKNPKAKLLAMSSVGGRLIEGVAMAHIVREFGLDTYVEFHCSSSCTFAFLGGKNRILAPHAKIGFHQASNSYYYLNPNQDIISEDGNMLMRSLYGSAKMDAAIIDEGLKTSPSEIWYPDTAKLLAGNVVTRLATKDDVKVASGSWASGRKLIEELNEDPLWQIVQTARPSAYQQAAAGAWDGVALQKETQGMLTKARTSLVRLLLTGLDQYPDDLVDDYIKLEADIWTDNPNVYNLNCGFGAATNFPVSNAVDKGQIARQLALFKSMAEFRVTSLDPGKAARSAAGAKMMEFWGLMIANEEYTSENVARNFCWEPQSYFKQLIKMPRSERLATIRAVAISTKGLGLSRQ